MKYDYMKINTVLNTLGESYSSPMEIDYNNIMIELEEAGAQYYYKYINGQTLAEKYHCNKTNLCLGDDSIYLVLTIIYLGDNSAGMVIYIE